MYNKHTWGFWRNFEFVLQFYSIPILDYFQIDHFRLPFWDGDLAAEAGLELALADGGLEEGLSSSKSPVSNWK